MCPTLDRERVQSQLRESLAPRVEIDFAHLFGSAVDSVAYNDVDVGVYLQPPLHHEFEAYLRAVAEIAGLPA